MSSKIYCNPAPIPNVPQSFPSLFKSQDGYTGEVMDFRDMADPEVLYFEGKWYVYPSQGQVYVSADLVNWEYCPIDIEVPLGYAPSVTMSKGKIYLTSSAFRGSGSKIFVSTSPLGPFKLVGEPKDSEGKPLKAYLDPALFTDDDGRMYLYWGCAPTGGGIFGMEVDPDNPCRGIGEIRQLIVFNGDRWWERYGEYGETTNYGWDEGVSMYKHNGRYCLQYSSNGTNFRSYMIAVFLGKGPLGPFEPPREPMIRKCHGIVCGTGHGGMFTGPGGQAWLAYTTAIHRVHMFERRLAFDPVTFDAEGYPHVAATDMPQFVTGGGTGMIPVSFSKFAETSSSLPGCHGNYAIDECSHTYWAPREDDAAPWFTLNLRLEYDVRAFRIMWAELNPDYAAGKVPQAVKYRITFQDRERKTVYVYDATDNERDLPTDFRLLEKPILAQYARLEYQCPDGIRRGLTDFTLFGLPTAVKY